MVSQNDMKFHFPCSVNERVVLQTWVGVYFFNAPANGSFSSPDSSDTLELGQTGVQPYAPASIKQNLVLSEAERS